jgi:hypothetical protein
MHERLAAQAAAMAEIGSSIETIAHAIGTDWQTARDAVEYGKANAASPSRAPIAVGKAKTLFVHPKAAEVVRLRQEEKWSFRRIAHELGMCTATATRAYDRYKELDTRRAAGDGRTPSRGSCRGLPREKVEHIHTLLREGRCPTEVARLVGCGIRTVYRERGRLDVLETR